VQFESLKDFLLRGAAANLIRLQPLTRKRSTAEGYQAALAVRQQVLAFKGQPPRFRKHPRSHWDMAATRTQGLGGRLLRGRIG